MKEIASRDTIESLRGKFQFLAVITLFFPVTLQAVFSIFEEAVKANTQIMSWGVLVAVLVLDYLLIEYLKDKMLVSVARYTEMLITLTIFCYVPVFVVFAMVNQPIIPYLYGIAMGVGIVGTMIIPLIIFLLLSVVAAYSMLRVEFTWVYKLTTKLLSKLYGRGDNK